LPTGDFDFSSYSEKDLTIHSGASQATAVYAEKSSQQTAAVKLFSFGYTGRFTAEGGDAFTYYYRAPSPQIGE
jgi:hypothetical protein